MTSLDKSQLCEFAERGFVLVPDVVPHSLCVAAMREIDAMIGRDPPPADKRGFHFYWLNDPAASNPLLSLLTNRGTLDAIESLIAPLKPLVPGQVQVSINIPPWNHHPGGPHLDGLTPPEPSGRPGTFTLLVGVFLTDQSEPDMGNLWVWPGSHRAGAAYLKYDGLAFCRSLGC